MPPRLRIVTAGCKSNFADSSSIVRQALSLGFVLAGEGVPADLVVVNGCTVTHRADRDSRALARKARRDHPSARVVVTGCFAETRRHDAHSVPEADLWLPPSEDPSLAAFLEATARSAGVAPSVAHAAPSVHESDLLLGRRRTFLKVQDGCDASCAYCAIPLARGRERSLPPGRVLDQARRAEDSGAREVVLTGIHVGRYGADRGESDGLSRLVGLLLSGTRSLRFRLGSVEPLEVTPALVAVASGDDRVCPHFHVPLQSGSDGVLRRMGRPYTAALYAEAVAAIRSALPRARIGADVIAGFPGETEREFGDTVELVAAAGIDYLHAFPFSVREGTAAALLPDDVSPAEKKLRVGALLARDREARRLDAARRVGTTEEMIAERYDAPSATLRGTTASYHAVRVAGEERELGRLVPVRIVSGTGKVLHGERLP